MATTIEKSGARVYLVNLPFAAKDEAKRVLGMSGKNWDGERKQWWVGAAKLADAEAFVAKLNAPAVSGTEPPAEDIDAKRVYAKVTHGGKTYYVIGQTLDADHQPLRVRLVAFAPEAVPFWTDAAGCELVKEYPGRMMWNGRRAPYNRDVLTFQTLGGIRKFVDKQKNAEAAGVPACSACGKRSAGLVEDLEDGLMKCRGCCDIPSE